MPGVQPCSFTWVSPRPDLNALHFSRQEKDVPLFYHLCRLLGQSFARLRVVCLVMAAFTTRSVLFAPPFLVAGRHPLLLSHLLPELFHGLLVAPLDLASFPTFLLLLVLVIGAGRAVILQVLRGLLLAGTGLDARDALMDTAVVFASVNLTLDQVP